MYSIRLPYESIVQNAIPGVYIVNVEETQSLIELHRVRSRRHCIVKFVVSPIYNPSSRCCSLILSRFARAALRFSACILDRSSFKHSLTFSLAVLQLPTALCMKPWAWHSSRAAMTSSHATIDSQQTIGGYLDPLSLDLPKAFFVWRWGCILDFEG